MAACHCCRRRIVTVARRTWTIVIGTVLILCIASLASLIAFYVCMYRPSRNEALFDDLVNCTVTSTKNATRTCDRQRQAACQLILVKCGPAGELENITVYSTWSDYETSSQQCTIDPCSSSAIVQFSVNQTLSFVHWSIELRRGYLQQTSRLTANIAQAILIGLAVLLGLSLLLVLAVIVILNVYSKWERQVFPINASNPNPSVYSRPPTIIVQKPSQSTKAKQNRSQANLESPTTSQLLVVPPETTLPTALEYQPRESLWRRSLEPLQLSTLSGVVATFRERQRSPAVRPDTDT